MKVLNKILGTVLAWFDNPAFSFVFALVLTMVAFVGADPEPGIPVSSVAVFAFLVGLLTVVVLLSGTSIVLHKAYNWLSVVYAMVGSALGSLLVVLLMKALAQ